MTYITVNKNRYLIRGPLSPREVRKHWESFKAKYPDTKLTLEQWMVSYGKVYFKVRSER